MESRIEQHPEDAVDVEEEPEAARLIENGQAIDRLFAQVVPHEEEATEQK